MKEKDEMITMAINARYNKTRASLAIFPGKSNTLDSKAEEAQRIASNAIVNKSILVLFCGAELFTKCSIEYINPMTAGGIATKAYWFPKYEARPLLRKIVE